MAELVTIPIAIVEIAAEFTHPALRLSMDRKDAVDKLFDGFKTWKISVDDIEVITSGRPSDQGVKFKLPMVRTSVFLGPTALKLTRDDADWGSAEETIEILDIGLQTIKSTNGIEIGQFKTSIALHLQPKNLSFIELLKPFAPERLVSLDTSELTAFAAVLRWNNHRVTIDGSAQLANGVYLKFEREFDGKTPYSEMASGLKRDEERLFELLGVEEDRQ